MQEQKKTEKGKQAGVQNDVTGAEDRAMKVAARYFGEEILRQFGIQGRIEDFYPTEYVHLEMKDLHADFNYRMEDGSCYHFEFESDSIQKEDLRRFRAYESVTSFQEHIPVVTHVVCSSDVKEPMTELSEGINTYRVRVIRMKDRDADAVFRAVEGKSAKGRTKEELLLVTLSPLMGGSLSVKERIRKGFRLLKEEHICLSKEELRQMQSILYVFALKFLKKNEWKGMEEIKMTALGEFLVEEGMSRGIAQGMAQGMEQGLSQGIAQGVDQGETFMGKLVQCLLRDNRLEEIDLAVEEPEIRKSLYREYHIGE